jgi:pimeloyl-ACP methyl ester carboxylesterase
MPQSGVTETSIGEPQSRLESGRVLAAGLFIHYLCGGAGPALVALHGSAPDAAGVSLAEVLPELAADHRVFAPDLPGFGESAPLPRDWGVRQLVGFLPALLDAWGLTRVDLVGYSFGGWLALGLALAHPERVQRLALINAAGLDEAIPGANALARCMVRLGARAPDALLDALWWPIGHSRRLAGACLRTALHGHRERATAAWIERVMAFAAGSPAARASRALQRREIGWRGGLRDSYARDLPRLGVPTLIVHGASDWLFPVASMERAARAIPDARLVVLQEASHLAPLEVPDRIAALLRDFFSVSLEAR